MNNISYEELPLQLRSRIKADDFLSAYSAIDSGNIILWVIEPDLNKQKELEFSFEENRFLSIEERESLLPEAKRITIPELGVDVDIKYKIEKDTNVLHEAYIVYHINFNKIIAESEQIHFTPYKTSLHDVVKIALKEYNFLENYKQWSEEDKVNYWTESLYRLRRQIGESGCDENDIFDKKLVKNMTDADPDIMKNILPATLVQLAKIEQANKNDLINTFEKKTGYKLT